jgi:hypothetical protein
VESPVPAQELWPFLLLILHFKGSFAQTKGDNHQFELRIGFLCLSIQINAARFPFVQTVALRLLTTEFDTPANGSKLQGRVILDSSNVYPGSSPARLLFCPSAHVSR